MAWKTSKGSARVRVVTDAGRRAISLIIGLASMVVSSGAAGADVLGGGRTVVLISLDGLAHYYLDDPKVEMPTIREMAAAGARAERMKAVMPIVTWPTHTTLVTGVTPARHGVVGNTYFDRAENEVVGRHS